MFFLKPNANRGFHKLDEIGNNANIGIRGFTTWKQKIPVKNVTPPPVRIEPKPLINLWFQVQQSALWANWTFDCKTETLGSLYNHALLIPTKSFKFKNQVKHKQKFKYPLNSTCQIS